jgi:hypothetical protein
MRRRDFMTLLGGGAVAFSNHDCGHPSRRALRALLRMWRMFQEKAICDCPAWREGETPGVAPIPQDGPTGTLFIDTM